jgi:hypothetical protein
VPASSTGKNPIVEYLNSLRTQERDANATYVHEQRAAFLSQLRAAHPWFPADSELLVPTRLDGLGDALRDRSAFGADLVFLTGDAGDGKTALCDHVARTIAGKPIDLREKTIVGDWLIVKDGRSCSRRSSVVSFVLDARARRPRASSSRSTRGGCGASGAISDRSGGR